jgi:CHAT domain-containing protein
MGDCDKALPILKRALEIYDKKSGDNRSNAATNLGLLAKLYCKTNDLHRAKEFALQAYAIRKKIFGPDHFIVSTSLITLGDISIKTKDYQQAERFYLQALKIRKKYKNPHGLVIILNKLGELYYATQDYISAERISFAAHDLGESYLDKDHVHFMQTLQMLGLIHAVRGKFQKANTFMEKAQKIETNLITHIVGYTSDEQKLAFMRKSNENQSIYLSLIFHALPKVPKTNQAAFNLVVTRKGVVLDMQRKFQEILLRGNTEALDVFNELSDVRVAISRLVFSEPENTELSSYTERLKELKAKKEQLEIRLSELSSLYMNFVKQRNANSYTIANKLAPRTVLIEFVRIRDYDFHAKTPTHKRWRDEKYYAFILHPQDPKSLDFVFIGDADPIDEMIYSLKNAVVSDRQNGNINHILTVSGRVYKHLFFPFKNKLHAVSTIFLSPDSYLNLLPFEILLQPTRRFLVEDVSFNYLSSGRDLLDFDKDHSISGNFPVVIGNPDFNSISGNKKINIDKGENLRTTFPIFKKLEFSPLPGAEKEAMEIASIIGKEKSTLLVGKDATEEALMSIEKPLLMHIATHGFFLKDQDLSDLAKENMIL